MKEKNDQPFIIRRSIKLENDDDKFLKEEEEKRKRAEARKKDVGFIQKKKSNDYNIVYRDKPTKPLTVDELFGLKKKEEPKKVVKLLKKFKNLSLLKLQKQ